MLLNKLHLQEERNLQEEPEDTMLIMDMAFLVLLVEVVTEVHLILILVELVGEAGMVEVVSLMLVEVLEAQVI
jgi:hypothetical protein